jgi:hypothetical protein
MLENRMRVVSSCGLFWLVLAAACDNERASFSDVESANYQEQADMTAAHRTTPRGASSGNASLASDAGGGSIGLPPSVSMTATGTLICGDAVCQCNNGVDDDGDGTADGFDVECTGGIDDDESSFATGIPGDNRDPKWQDCFFDGNSGAGDDRCRYPTECLTGELPLSDDQCSVTQACRDNCQPRTPNGCDCFGCCSVALPGGGRADVLLVDTCSAEKIGDTEACPVCVPSPECAAPPGDPEPPEPGEPDAGGGEPPASCGDRPECDEAGECSAGLFCSQGCCLVVIE